MTTQNKLQSLAKALGVLTLKTKLTFGKYKRKTLEYVLEHDPDYIIWLVENTNQVIDKRVISQAATKVLTSMDTADAFDVEAELDFDIEETF